MVHGDITCCCSYVESFQVPGANPTAAGTADRVEDPELDHISSHDTVLTGVSESDECYANWYHTPFALINGQEIRSMVWVHGVNYCCQLVLNRLSLIATVITTTYIHPETRYV